MCVIFNIICIKINSSKKCNLVLQLIFCEKYLTKTHLHNKGVQKNYTTKTCFVLDFVHQNIFPLNIFTYHTTGSHFRCTIYIFNPLLQWNRVFTV